MTCYQISDEPLIEPMMILFNDTYMYHQSSISLLIFPQSQDGDNPINVKLNNIFLNENIS